MALIYPRILVDEQDRIWTWSGLWHGYRTDGEITHGYDAIKESYGIREEIR